MWKQDFERQNQKTVYENPQKKPGNHDKVQEKTCPRKENLWNSCD